MANTCCQTGREQTGGGGGFAFILVLFILVILVGATTKSE